MRGNWDEHRRRCHLEGLDRRRGELDKLAPAELTRFLVDAAVISDMIDQHKPEQLVAAATALALDPKAIMAAAIKSAKVDEPAAAKKSKPKKAKAAK